MPKKNYIVHLEWRTKNVERLKNFYGDLFRWKFKGDPAHYTEVNFGNKEFRGGLFALPDGAQLPPGILNYINVNDLPSYEEKIVASGGRVLMSGHEVPGLGAFTVFQDPDGNTMALWRTLPKKAMKRARKEAKRAAKDAARSAEKQARKAEKVRRKKEKDVRSAEKSARKAEKMRRKEEKSARKAEKSTFAEA